MTHDAAMKRGDICVIRGVNGVGMVLRLHDQSTYCEWGGCFSLIYDEAHFREESENE